MLFTIRSGFIVSLIAMSAKGAGGFRKFGTSEINLKWWPLFCISGDIAVGVLALIIGVGFGVAALGDFMLIVRVRDEIFISHFKP